MPTREDATLFLDAGIDVLPGVAGKRAAAFAKLGVSTIRDLLCHFPRRYLDLTNATDIAHSRIGDTCTLTANVHDVVVKHPRKRLTVVEIHIVDGTGIMILTFFNQRWLADKFKAGMRISVSGKVEYSYGYKRMTHPIIEDAAHIEKTGSIVPIYPANADVTTDFIRKCVAEALSRTRGCFDALPLGVRARRGLVSRARALECIHFPNSMQEQAIARRRLAYEELLYLQLYLQRQNIRAISASEKCIVEGEANSAGEAVAHVVDGPCVHALADALPFTLSQEQIQAKDEILGQMSRPAPMNHMLMGDVGCGKTVVAAFALAAAKDSGGQAFLLAPTEVLATQHMHTLEPLLARAGATCALLTGATPADVRANILARLADGQLDVLIGTHALLEPAVRPARLTLAVIDEQQRFGVDQRNRLLAKGGAPDALSLSATPIPRTLAIATLGNYTLSFIRHPAKSHAPRATRVLRKTDRGEAYGQALAELEAGHRVYVVCPLIGTKGASRDADDADTAEGRAVGAGHGGGSGATKKSKAERFEVESEEADPDFVDIDDFEAWRGDNPSAAATEAEFLRRRIFCPYEVALLHGAMPAAEKARVMQDFAEGRVQVLVSTTVIEVGVDVPEATVMIIEDADRFGLSQLHQLRGRIGRGGDKSYAYLVSSTKREDALARLEFMTHCDDGFELAEFDLSLRREGDILGVRQSGASSLKLVKLAQDAEIIEAAHADAAEMLAHDATLTATTHAAIAREIKITIEDRPDGGSKGGMRK